MRWLVVLTVCAGCVATKASAPPERPAAPAKVERSDAIWPAGVFRLRFVIPERESPEQTPFLYGIAPNARGEVWLGGSRNLRGLLTERGFSPLPAGMIRDCPVETVTRSILVRKDDSVDFVGLQRCVDPQHGSSETNLLEHTDGTALRALTPPSSSERLGVTLYEPMPGHLYATLSDSINFIQGEGTGGSLHEWTPTGWQLRLALRGEGISSLAVDQASRLWMTAIQYGPGETPTRILRWEGSSWVSEAAPAWGGTVAAGDGSLFFQGLHGLWLRDGGRWIPRPAPQDRVIVAVLPRTKDDIYFLLFPSSVLHYDGSGFTRIPIEGVVSGRTEPGAPVNLALRGEHLWLHSSDRVWKLAPEDTPQPAPVTF